MRKLMTAREPDWASLSKEWEQSGLSQQRFCDEKGIPYTIFCSRRGELRKRERQKARLVPAKPRPLSQFIPVAVEADEPKVAVKHPAASTTLEVEVELPFGITLRIRGLVPS